MEVFRISSSKYSGKLSASGRAARWSRDQQLVLYTGESRSLAALELLVHKNISSVLRYKVMVISMAEDEQLYTRLRIKDLPEGWRDYAAYPLLQDIGSDWYINQQSLILQVPSVIVPQEFNYIINTAHPDFSGRNVSLVRTEEYYWDERLIPGATS